MSRGMGSYNGFSPEQRTQAGRWLRQQWASGALQRPSECVFCGQRAGLLQAHAEDYSGPDELGRYPGAGEFPACYRCHMLLHCRFSAPDAFEEYVRMLEEGWRWPPLHTANFATIRRFLARHGHVAGQLRMLDRRPEPCDPCGEPGLLRDIAAGHYRPPVRPWSVPWSVLTTGDAGPPVVDKAY